MKFDFFRHDSGAVERCVNLRPAADGSLKPAMPPAVLQSPAGWTPLCSMALADKELLLMKNGAAVGFLVDGAVPRPFALEGEPSAAWAVGDHILVTTARATAALSVDPDTLALSPAPDFDSMLPSLTAFASSSAFATPAAVKVDTAAAARGLLTSVERRALADAAVDTYAALDRSARLQGLGWQPALGRVRALTAEGHELFTTEPVLLTRPDGSGWDGTLAYDAAAASADTAVAPEISAPTWKARLAMSPELIEALPPGAVVQVLMSPPLARHSASLKPSVAPRMRAGSPLVTVALAPLRHNIPELVADIDALTVPVWQTRTPSLTADIDIALPEKASSGAAVREPSLRVRRAEVAATAADIVVWGAPETERPAPPSATCFAAETAGQGAWHAAVWVDFADGSRLVSTSEGTSGAPLAFSPLLSYPAADAVRLSIALSAGGAATTGSFPLTPDPSGRRALYVHPSGVPFSLPERMISFFVPAEIRKPVKSPRTLAMASTANPLKPIATAAVAEGDITALAAAPRGQSAWDFGRSRFYVFTRRGIFMLNADPSRRSLSTALIDGRAVCSPQAVTAVDGAIAAIGGADIVEISGANVRRIAPAGAARALAWNHADHELWCIGPEAVEVVCMLASRGCYTMPLALDPMAVSAGFERAYLRSADGLAVFIAGHAGGNVPVDVEWRGILGENFARQAAVVAEVPGTYSNLRLTLLRTVGADDSGAPQLRIEASGRVGAPLKAPLLTAPLSAPLLIADFSARASSDARLRRITVKS